jgi:hypothetical protein
VEGLAAELKWWRQPAPAAAKVEELAAERTWRCQAAPTATKSKIQI